MYFEVCTCVRVNSWTYGGLFFNSHFWGLSTFKPWNPPTQTTAVHPSHFNQRCVHIILRVFRAKPGDVWRARLALTLVACLYGTNYATIKHMGGLMDTSSLLTLRFGLAALALLPALRGVGKGVILAGAEVGIYATLGYGAQAYAMTVRERRG